MSSGKTANLRLNSWAGTDQIQREEFNADNAAIDRMFIQMDRAPTSSDNASAGYNYGTIWTDTFAGKLYAPKYIDASSAEWMEIRDFNPDSKADTEHSHAVSDIKSGTLPIANGGTGQSSAQNAALALGRGYGICTTAAETAAKTGTLGGFVRSTGSVVGIRFTNANTASAPTLNANSTGAAAIHDYRTGAAPVSGAIGAATTHFFMFNGSEWVLLNPVVVIGNVNYNAALNVYNNRVEIITSGSWTCPDGVTKIDILLAGGGGGGGGNTSGTGNGGGGGRFLFQRNVKVTPGIAYTITIGSGGTGGASANGGYGSAGGSTSAFGYTVEGGGGSTNTIAGSGGNGGSGYGSSVNDMQPGGSYGASGGTRGGQGLDELTIDPYTWKAYCGGGGSGHGYGGAGGGGNGSRGTANAATAGKPNTGGGGGGSPTTAGFAPSGDGGSGIVVIYF